MTTVFASNNTPRTKEAFRLRRDFMELNKIPTNIIFERDKYLFETPDFLPLIPKRSMMSTISEGTSVLNTTKESYNNFVEYVSTKTLQNKMNITFVDINKKVSFETSDPLEKYREKNIRHYNAFIRYLDRNKNIIINNYNDFYINFTNFIYSAIRVTPFTLYSTLSKSKIYYQNTGLVIYFKDKNLDDDNEIYDNFIINKGSTYSYIKAANLFGFEVDKRVPYRMVFNPRRTILNSNLIDFYRVNFEDYYDQELSFFQNYLQYAYRKYQEDKVYNFLPNNHSLRRVHNTYQTISQQYDVTARQKVSFFINCLFLEKGIKVVSEKEKIIKAAAEIAETLDMRAALVYIIGQVNRLANTRVTIVSNARF